MRKINLFKSSLMIFFICFGLTSLWGQETTFFEFTGSYSAPPADGWTSDGAEGGSYLKLSPGSVTSPLFDPANNIVFKYDIASFGSGGGTNTKLFILNNSDTVISEFTLTSVSSSTYTQNQTVNVGNITTNFKIKIEGFGQGSTTRGTRLQNYSLIGEIIPISNDPTLLTSTTSITDLNYMEGEGPSAAQSFELSGANLDGTDVTAVAPANFEISLSESGTYSGSLSLTAYDGASTEIWTRLQSGLNINTYTGDITISGGGAENRTVSLSGEVSEIPEPFSLPYSNGLRSQEDIDEAEGHGFEFNDTSLQTSAGGYVRMPLNSNIVSPAIDFSQYDEIIVSFDMTTFGGETGQQLSLLVSNDNGANYTVVNTYTTPGGYQTFSENIDLTSLNGLFGRIKFEMTAGTNQIRFRDLNLDLPVSETITWDGLAWSNGTGPAPTDNVLIDGALSISTDAPGLEVNDLVVSENGSVTVESGNSMTLNGSLTNNATSADFIVESGANLIQTGDAVNTGDITVYQNSESMVRNDMTLWSSPVAGQSIRDFSSETLYNRFWTYDEANTTYLPIFASDSDDQDFEEGAGYGIRVRNTLPTGESEVKEGEFVGIPYNGNVSVPVAMNGSGFNIVGNPYASNISVQGTNGFLAANTAVEALYLWTHTYPVGSPEYGNNYATFTLAGGTLGDLNYISKGQGFFVKVSAPGNVVFDNSMRTADNAQFYKQEDELERHRIWLSISKEDQKLGQILVAYMTGASNDFDLQIDGKLMGDGSTQFYNLLANEKYAIQGRALPFEASDVVPLGFNVAEAGTYKINLEDFDGLFQEGQLVYLKDNESDIVHNLSEAAYIFESEAGEFNERFEVVYQPDGTMGVDDLTANGVMIYKNNGNIEIASKNSNIVEVELFDLQGRKVFNKEKVNTNLFQIKSSSLGSQVLVVRVLTQDGRTTTKKVINH